MRRLILATGFVCSVVLAGIASGTASAGQLVVVESTTPGLGPGQILDGLKPLTLAAGARVTVIAEDGRIRSLVGPFSGVPDPSDPPPAERSLVASLSRLIVGPSREMVLGTLRANISPDPLDPWAVNVFRSGIHCVVEGSVPRLWRPDSKRAVTLGMKMLPYGAKVASNWPAGVATIDWPKGLILKDGSEYLVKRGKGLTATKVNMRLVPEDLPTDAHRIMLMADRGCIRQARRLLHDLMEVNARGRGESQGQAVD